MNKLDLIAALRNEAELTKSEAATVVDLFFMRWPMHLQKVTGLKSGDCVHFMSRNTKRMPEEILKRGKRSRLDLRSFRFSNAGKS